MYHGTFSSATDKQPTTTQVSVDPSGNEANSASSSPSISSDGKYVAFESIATNLLGVGNDNNGWPDIFVHDRDADGDGMFDEAGEVSTIRVSVYSDETESIDPSNNPSISSDGRYVAFESSATKLVPGGSNGFIHIFVHDRDTDGDGQYDEPGEVSTVLVSVDSAGAGGSGGDSSSCSDGRYVAFASGGELDLTAIEILTLFDVFVHDRDTDGDGIYDEPGEVSTVRVSVDSAGAEGNGNSNLPSISADGSSVTFESDATNLMGVGNDNNGVPDIFADDLQAGAGGGGESSSGGGGCFIATAADGSGMAGEVK